jgi:hypothetical protein
MLDTFSRYHVLLTKPWCVSSWFHRIWSARRAENVAPQLEKAGIASLLVRERTFNPE